MKCETSNIPRFCRVSVVGEEMSFNGDDSHARPTVEYLEERRIATRGFCPAIKKRKKKKGIKK